MKEPSFGARAHRLLSSMGLCCVLLLCLFVLTILGTFYQVDHGLYAAKKRYFESFLVWQEVGGTSVPIFPGGVACMLLLAVNMFLGQLRRLGIGRRKFGLLIVYSSIVFLLVAVLFIPLTVTLLLAVCSFLAAVLRLRIGWRGVGVMIVHLGILILLVAGLAKMVSGEEGILRLFEGQQSDYFESERLWEVAIWEIGGAEPVPEHVIEHSFFSDLDGSSSRTFTSKELPFDLVLSGFVPNCRALPEGAIDETAGPIVDGYGLRAVAAAGDDELDVAGLHAEARVGGESRRGILWGFEVLPWTVNAGGKDWAITLRLARYPMPFSIRLEDFEKEDHPGMRMAKAYRSTVTRIDDAGSDRVLIQMNEPLRHEGLVFFQSSWGPQNLASPSRFYSVFSVVRNPADRWPEYALWVITAGLVIAFGRKLLVFLASRERTPAGPVGSRTSGEEA